MYHDELSTSQWNSLMTVACNYIQNDDDMELVRQLESGLLQKLSPTREIDHVIIQLLELLLDNAFKAIIRTKNGKQSMVTRL